MIDFSITTPEKNLVNEPVDSVTLPTETGEITVLNNHIPLVSNLVPGEVKYSANGQSKYFAVSGGFIEVKKGNKVVVLANTAEVSEEIDIDRAQKARDEAKAIMEQKHVDKELYANAAAALERSLARLRVAHKHRTRSHQVR